MNGIVRRFKDYSSRLLCLFSSVPCTHFNMIVSELLFTPAKARVMQGITSCHGYFPSRPLAEILSHMQSCWRKHSHICGHATCRNIAHMSEYAISAAVLVGSVGSSFSGF